MSEGNCLLHKQIAAWATAHLSGCRGRTWAATSSRPLSYRIRVRRTQPAQIVHNKRAGGENQLLRFLPPIPHGRIHAHLWGRERPWEATQVLRAQRDQESMLLARKTHAYHVLQYITLTMCVHYIHVQEYINMHYSHYAKRGMSRFPLETFMSWFVGPALILT